MRKIKSKVLLCTLLALSTSLYGQTNEPAAKKWGAEVNLLWPIYPGNIYSFLPISCNWVFQ